MERIERDGNQSISQSRTGNVFFPLQPLRFVFYPSRSVSFFPLAAPFRFFFFTLTTPFRFFSAVNLFLQKRLLPFVNDLNFRYRTLLYLKTSISLTELCLALSLSLSIHHTVKSLITNTSEEFIKCRLDNFSMTVILYQVNFSICETK